MQRVNYFFDLLSTIRFRFFTMGFMLHVGLFEHSWVPFIFVTVGSLLIEIGLLMERKEKS
jgi:hypothetical protein